MMFVRYRVAVGILYGAARLLGLYLGARQVLAGGSALQAAVSLGTFQGTLTILSRSSRRVASLAETWGGLQDTTIAMARVFEMLGSVGEGEVDSGDALPPRALETLRFECVSFAYADNEPVLSDFGLEARAGTITAIEGPSGAGKSTIVSILLRFINPTSGRVTANAVDIRAFQLAAWRGIISVR